MWGGDPAVKLNAFTLLAPVSNPVIVNFSPLSAANTTIPQFTMNGTSFRSGATITFRNGTSSLTVPTTLTGNSRLTCSLPLASLPVGIYTVTVKNTDGSGNTSQDTFAVVNPVPAITTVLPASAYNTAPAAVTISGTNFVSGLEVSLVNRSTIIQGVVSGRTQTKCTGTFNLTGQPAGIYNMTLVNPGGPNTTRMNAFTVLTPVSDPMIINFSPQSGPNTVTIPLTINGTNFRTGAAVTITNGSTSKTVTGTLTGQTKIVCNLPLTGMPLGLYTVRVKNTDGSGNTSPDLFAITNPKPAVSTILPISAFNTSPIAVTISGTNFVSGLDVSLVNGSRSIPRRSIRMEPDEVHRDLCITRMPVRSLQPDSLQPGRHEYNKGECVHCTCSQY